MGLNNNINLSILRIYPLDTEKSNSENFQVEYKNGVYYLQNNFELFEKIKKDGQSSIDVELINDIQTVVSHLEYRLMKEKLNPIETALLTKELEQIYDTPTTKIAKRLNKTAGDLSNKKRLLKLPIYIQSDIINGILTERHGRAFLQLVNKNKENLIKNIYEQVKVKSLKVADTEKLIDKAIDKEKPSKELVKIDKRVLTKRVAIPAINQLENDFKKSLELIEKYYPELEIIQEEGLDSNDYTMKIIIKNVK